LGCPSGLQYSSDSVCAVHSICAVQSGSVPNGSVPAVPVRSAGTRYILPFSLYGGIPFVAGHRDCPKTRSALFIYLCNGHLGFMKDLPPQPHHDWFMRV